MNDSISKGEIIHAVNAEVNKPKKVRYKLHTPIEEVVIEFDEKEEVTSIDHILSDSIPIFEESAQAYKAWTSEDMGKTEPSDLISRANAINAFWEDSDIRTAEVRATLKALPSADAESDDIIIKGAKGIQDGLYNIKDGKLFMYKANGGTVRTYPIVPSADRPTEDYSDLPDIPRAYYEKIVGNMSHEINMLKQQLEDRPTHDCTNLVQWLLEETMDEESWRENADANGEIICRKLKKLGVLDTKDGYYIRTPLAYDDRPSGEWVNEWKDIDGGRMYGACCSVCHTIGHSGYNYCPSCGARMKGGAE